MEMQRHRREAAELHVQLLEERLEEERGKAERDAAGKATLDEVLQKVTGIPKSLQHHVTNITRQRSDDIKLEVRQRAEEIRLEVGRQLNKRCVWEIKNASALKHMPKDESIQSPVVHMCGHAFHVEFFPNGVGSSGAGCSFICLPGSSELAGKVKFTFNGSLSKDNCSLQSGFQNWPTKEKVFSGCKGDTLVIEVEITSIAELLKTTYTPAQT